MAAMVSSLTSIPSHVKNGNEIKLLTSKYAVMMAAMVTSPTSIPSHVKNGNEIKLPSL